MPFPFDAKSHAPDDAKEAVDIDLTQSPGKLEAFWGSQIDELGREEEWRMRETNNWSNEQPERKHAAK